MADGKDTGTATTPAGAVALTTEELEKRVEAARQARSVHQRSRDETIHRKKLEEELKLTEIEAVEGTLGIDLRAIFSPIDGSMVVVRKPPQSLWQQFSAKALANKQQPHDLFVLVRGTLLYPDRASFDAICQTSPGMLEAAANAVAAMAGHGEEEVAGK